MKNRNSQKKSRNDKFRSDMRNRNYKDAYRETDTGGLSKKDRSYHYSTNDWRWYAQSEQLVKDTASLAFGYGLGSRLNFGTYGDSFNTTSIPGIMAIHIAPSFGFTTNETSPLNLAAQQLYSYVLHANAGASNYDPMDLMIYIGALDSAYSYWEFLKRVYGIAMSASITNRYYPRAVVQSMLVDYDDVQTNLADFRAFINLVATKISAYCIPDTMPWIAKHRWMFSHVFADSPAQKAQSYLFVPQHFYGFALEEGTAKGYLNAEQYTGGQTGYYKVSDLISFWNNLWIPFEQEGTHSRMSADILKAYGEGSIIKIDMIPESYVVLTEYDETVLDQIQNLTLVGDPAYGYMDGSKSSWNLEQIITDDSGRVPSGYLSFFPVVQNPVFKGRGKDFTIGRNVYSMDKLITFMKSDVQPSDVMEATRLMNYVDFTLPDDTKGIVTTAASEIATFARIYTYGVASDGSWYSLSGNKIYTVMPAVIEVASVPEATSPDDPILEITLDELVNKYTQLSEVFEDINKLTCFDRHPLVVPANGVLCDSGAVNPAWISTFNAINSFRHFVGDINNYSYVSKQDLSQMNEVAMLSMFNVGNIAKG